LAQRNPVFNINADFYIEKLKDMVRADPDSKLFLTLAEELRKRGEPEEAMSVLKTGIVNNPFFISARLTLGRWHLRDGMLAEAAKEFAQVLERAPDDRFAVRYIKEIEDLVANTKGPRAIERLNKLLYGIRKAFAADSLKHAGTGDR
jgi:tetratricopeptide (TPR) repeat protein